MSSHTFNITPRMIHLQAFNWLKQFAKGLIMMQMALDSIEFILGPNFNSDKWMDLTHCVVMEPGCWSDIKKIFMQELGIEKSSSKLHVPPSGVLIMSGAQGSASKVPRSPDPLSVPSVYPLLKDPSVWHLVMDWAQDKIGYCELDEKMWAYGSCYVNEEWKGLIDEVFMQSEPGADNTVSAPLLIQRAMELHGFSHGAQEGMSLHSPPGLQIPTGIFLPPCKNIYIVDFYSASTRVFIVKYIKLKVLPTQGWVQIKKSRYKGNIGYVGESTDSDAIMLVTPHQLPYDPPEESGERARFDVARITDVDVVPILSSSGTEIRHTCGGQQFIHGLLRLPIPVDTLETVELPHPDDIRFHVVAGINLLLHNFGERGTALRYKRGTSEERPGYLPTWIGTSDIEVSKFVVQSYLNEHVLSLGPEGNEHQLPPQLSVDEALPGNIAEVHCGPYVGQRGTIEWIGPNGKIWDKGYNVAVGNIVEVARGPWYPSHGVVKAVDLTKASLDVMHVVDGVQMNVPITFVCKMKEHSDHGLSKFVGHDVWVIAGDKKGSQATLHSLRRILGMLLDGTLLPPQLQYTLRFLHCQSFITPAVQCTVTPLPSPGPSAMCPLDAWSVTPADCILMQTPNYGFNISISFTQVSLGKHIVQTHLTIPAQYLMPANPTGKNQLCLVLKGSQAGRVLMTIMKYYCGQLVPIIMGRHISLTHHMGLIQSYFARVLVTPLNCESDEIPTGEGSPIPCDLTHTVQDQNFMLDPLPKISCTTLPVIQTSPCTMQVTQKHKFHEDQDLAVGPPLKISHGTHSTLLVIPWNHGNDTPIPCDHPVQDFVLDCLLKISCTASLVTQMSMQMHKFHKDQALVVGPLLKISHGTHSASLVPPSNHGNDKMTPTWEGSPMSCDLTGTVQVQVRIPACLSVPILIGHSEA
ncbi:hypothetical protein EDC04DRAFT_2614098 [Pisolithus marmoratus]|nr:hypothetical protein EDC04DRAFT_2614098 [Pisolithus marmoratus]